MRRVALIIGADPKHMKFGPEVVLGRGMWEVQSEQPAHFRVHHTAGCLELLPGTSGSLKHPGVVRVELLNGDGLSHVTVYATSKE